MERETTPQEEVKPRHGKSFLVDTSSAACGKFGFTHGDRIRVTALDKMGTVVGVAPHIQDSPEGIDALWVRLDGEEAVCFFPNPKSDFERAQ